ncbi:hypothetical protein [Photobacterium sp. TY1-4]|uniref:hypothetical protein n=1 Tax=Photobacterium sp. TY1-4 TaxID=2899122 RepID=UPI0021BE5EAE|nr:hypothetical protein [Photobacterium sp. TY1-4]UXI04694.1 hypothetical protein NH461_25345 [Photobacterium sp. TY1-4]
MNKSGIAFSFLSVALLMGCNGSSGSNDVATNTGTEAGTNTGTNTGTNNAAPTTYTFIDEPVKGLYYASATQSGCTDEDGHYKAMPDESVEFYIGKCDENNEPTLTDQAIMIGMVETPLSHTTPYHLQVSSTNTVSVDPITVATILKTINRSSDSERIDLTGLLFNSNGVDLRKTIQDLIESPGTAASTVLDTALYNNIVLANTNSNLNFVQPGFLDESTVKSELSSTLGKLVESSAFTVEDVAGKTILTNGKDTYAFAESYTTGYTFAFNGHLTVNNGSSYDWGILGVDGSGMGDKGDLRIDVGASTPIVVKPVGISDTYWVVSVDGGNSEIWTVEKND